MAQATGAMSARNMYVGVSTDGNTWTDVSGYANSVEVSGGERDTGTMKTYDGDYPILTTGKRNTVTITVRGVYTESTAQYFTTVNTAYEAGTSFYVRWSPGGGDAGDVGFTSGKGYIKNAPYPSGSADNGDPVITELVLEAPYVTKAAIGTAGW